MLDAFPIIEKSKLDSKSFSLYRDRLIKKGVLTSKTYGYLCFTLPRFYEFLKKQCRDLFKLPIIVAKNLKLKLIKGKIIIDKMEMGTIQLGFACDPGFDVSSLKGVFYNSGTIIVHENLKACKGVSIKVFKEGILEVGSCWINSNTHIICAKNTKTGNGCMISWGTYIMDTDYHPIYADGVITNEDKPISIGDRCLICMNASILKGSKVPDCSVIVANSTVTKELTEPNCVYLNNVAIKHNITW